jgi:hypothetical protein
MIRRSLSAAAGAVLFLAVTIEPLLAQESASSETNQEGWWSRMGQMMDNWGPGWRPDLGPMMNLDPAELLDRIEGRLAFVKAELKVTQEQEAAWTEFANVMRKAAAERAGSMSAMMNDMKSGAYLKRTLPERLADQESRMRDRLDQTKTVRAAVEKFYATLSDEQKKAADEIVMPMMGMGGRGMGWWR